MRRRVRRRRDSLFFSPLGQAQGAARRWARAPGKHDHRQLTCSRKRSAARPTARESHSLHATGNNWPLARQPLSRPAQRAELRKTAPVLLASEPACIALWLAELTGRPAPSAWPSPGRAHGRAGRRGQHSLPLAVHCGAPPGSGGAPHAPAAAARGRRCVSRDAGSVRERVASSWGLPQACTFAHRKHLTGPRRRRAECALAVLTGPGCAGCRAVDRTALPGCQARGDGLRATPRPATCTLCDAGPARRCQRPKPCVRLVGPRATCACLAAAGAHRRNVEQLLARNGWVRGAGGG